jgi:hypothetical protein
MNTNLGNYYDFKTIFPIFMGALTTELIFLAVIRYFPTLTGKWVKQWWTTYGLSAILCDVAIMTLGVLLTRYVYTKLGWKWSLAKFLVILVVLQLIHDFLLYALVIKPLPKGHNAIFDLFKKYGADGGWTILAGDAAMVILTVLFALYYTNLKDVNQYMILFLILYVLPYFLHKDGMYHVY